MVLETVQKLSFLSTMAKFRRTKKEGQTKGTISSDTNSNIWLYLEKKKKKKNAESSC